ncbi:MAG: hypothetical protein HY360_05970 [Verrucomicrobia bacterium]|nr:hypothetical protein [Verrucomicrobiota bacterium]
MVKYILILIFLFRAGASICAAERTLFSADLDTGAEGKDYTKVNPDVTWLLNNGGWPFIRILDPPFAPKPVPALEWNSGTHNKPSVLGVCSIGHRERYGQVFLCVGRPAPSASWLDVSVLGDKQLETKGPNVVWDPNGKFRRLTSQGERTTEVQYPTNRLHEITLNYDLEEKTFDVWCDQEKIIEEAPFASREFQGGASGLALGATWWSAGAGSLIIEWRWKARDQAFTQPFKPAKP